MVDSAGHYPHVEFPEEAGGAIVPFAQQATKQEANGAA
jgi:hypothetical protein